MAPLRPASLAVALLLGSASASMAQMPGDSGGVMPGGSPGQASPPQPPPCMAEFAPLRTETEKRAVAIKAAAAKHALPQELCPLFVHFIEAEVKVVKFMEQRAASCGIPAQVVSVTKANHQKALQTKERVCAAAGERAQLYSREVFCSRATNVCVIVCSWSQNQENCEAKCVNRRATCQQTGCYYLDRLGEKCDRLLVRWIGFRP